jgi:DNA-binding response OmpR family regulator
MAKRILIADDDDNIRELLSVTLEDEGYELHEAKDGNEAWGKAQKLRPDLVIIDVMMPGIVGYKVCENIKSDPALRHAYVIILTARGTPVAEMTGKTQSADEFLTKPFDPQALRQKINKILGK